jgi:glycerol-3-phosphate acyltransferase PlsX
MGGDRPALELFPALIEVCKFYHYEHTLVAFVQHSLVSELQALVDSYLPPEGKRKIELVSTSSYITMDESPLLAVRRKKDSSMAAAMRLLASGELDGVVSMGNTGALVATSMLYLPMLPTIERAALLVSLPSAKKDVLVLDVGANIEPKPEHLVNYARMAMAYHKAFFSTETCKVGLLNVGAEELKGTAWHKRAYQLLEETLQEQFVGNVEGRIVFEGQIDILVTDGFSGNVFLKTCEGVASFLTDYLSYKMTKFGGVKSSSIVAHLHKQFNYSQRPGALLCGVGGLVVKCHGHSSLPAIVSGIKGAIALAQAQVVPRIATYLSS